MTTEIKIHIKRAGAAFILLIMTLFIYPMIYSQEQERNIPFGHPIPFIFMDSSYDLFEVAHHGEPYRFCCIFDWRQHPTRVSGKNFFLSFFIIFIFLEIALLLIDS